MKALKVLLGLILLIVAAGAVLSFIAPTEMLVEKEVQIEASPETVWKNLSSLEAINAWSPWNEKDPFMETSYEGESGTVGSKHSWSSDSANVGVGYEEIVEIGDGIVKTKLVFTKPWESESDAWVKMTPSDNGTTVSWGFTSEMPIPMNIMGMFMDMTGDVEKDFEKGLANLKAKAERMDPINGYSINELVWESPRMYLGKREVVPFDKMADFFGKNFGKAFKEIGKAGLQPAGMPSGIFFEFNEETMVADVAAVAPVTQVIESKDLAMFEAPAGKVLHIAYMGDYGDAMPAHQAMDQFMKKYNMELNDLVIEEYVTDPTSEPDTSKWLTNIYYLIK